MIKNNEFNFCPNCGTNKIKYLQNKKWFCSECGFDLYNNVASAVGVIFHDKNCNVLFEKRAKNPRKGFLALPGGFCDRDETAEQAVIRECLEETGAKPNNIKYLCSFPNDYEYKDIQYKTCDLFFTALLEDESMEDLICKLKEQASEVESFCACKVSCFEDIEKIPLAFNSAKNALTCWIEQFNLNKDL